MKYTEKGKSCACRSCTGSKNNFAFLFKKHKMKRKKKKKKYYFAAGATPWAAVEAETGGFLLS